MSADDQGVSLADDLALRSDDDLFELLAARPDLASPPPAGTGVLASRALAAPSSALVGEDLDLLDIAVLEQVIALGTGSAGRIPAPTSIDAVVAALSGRADDDEIIARVHHLRTRALVWGPDDAIVSGAHASAALPWRAHHLTGPLARHSAQELQSRLDDLDERERSLLDTLSRGPALGRSRDAAPDADPNQPVARLIAQGLLARIDAQTVELPPMVGQLLRGEPPLHTTDLRAPALHDATAKKRFSHSAIDAAAGGEAIELVRHTSTVIRVLGATPATVLRSGALGVRELRRLAKVSGLEQQRVAFIVELLAYLRLIDAGFPDPPPANDNGELAFAPTATVDGWLHHSPDRQWAALLGAWLEMPRRAWQIGEPDRDGNALAALSGELHDAYAPRQRRAILDTLATATRSVPVDTDALVSALHWRHPRQMRRYSRRVVEQTLREARELGVVAHGALTGVGRAAIGPGEPADAESRLLSAMRLALPEPVDHFLTQADLTLTVPGPMTPELAEQVDLVADLESGGAASVYRVSENSVRRALDAGRTSSELLTMFTAHSSTPVPQSLTYLIEDVARKHGQLRVGVAAAFVRCEDAATLAAVMRSNAAEHLALRALAPTVAVSQAEVRDVIDRLREAGFAPAGEDSTGTLVDLRERGARVGVTRARRQPQSRRPAASPDQLRSVISRMRSADRAASARPAAADTSPAPVRASGGGESATALIQLALRVNRRLRVDYVDAQGSASRHVVTPRTLGAGQLIAVDAGSDEEQRFSLHRITSVELLEA